jgi:uncharacterized protein YdgA (DUF945 family)
VKRWIVALLVVAALVLLISPGIVGHLAERNLQQNIDWAEIDAPEVRVRTESFERGWFSSEGRHRISLAGAPLLANRDHAASIIVETRVDHGIVPFTSMAREGGSLEPGLAQAVSTFQLDLGNGDIVELPGKAFSRMGLSGITDVQYLLQEGAHENARQKTQWDGAEVFLSINPDGQTLTVDGSLQSVSFISDTESGSIGAIKFRGREQRTDYGFSIGDVDISSEAIRFTGADGISGGFQELTLKGETRLEDAQVNADYSMNIGGLSAPMLGELGIDLSMSVAGLDAPAVGKISAAIRDAKTSADPAQAMSGIFPLIEKDLQTLLAAGGSVDIERLDVSMPQGDITSKISVTIDESDPNAGFSWPAVALLLSATADISMPEMLVEMMLMFSPQADAIRQMGLLRKNGNAYEVQAAFKQGLLTVNGAPFPIPLHGF